MLDFNTSKSQLNRNTFSVFTNPRANIIYVDFENVEKGTSCQIFDMAGCLIKEYRKLSKRNTISLQELPSGNCYTIKINDMNKIITKKILKF